MFTRVDAMPCVSYFLNTEADHTRACEMCETPREECDASETPRRKFEIGLVDFVRRTSRRMQKEAGPVEHEGPLVESNSDPPY